MLVTYCLFFMLYIGQCQIIPIEHMRNEDLIQCVITILTKYFTEITHVSIDTDDEDLLKAIHTMETLSLVTRSSDNKSETENRGYLITSKNVTMFTKHFEYLIMDSYWNPYARFLIVIECLKTDELRNIFDVILKSHANNVVVVNGTHDAHLYTYNPFDNYACGRYYTEIINLGLCSQISKNLYPNKLVTGLKNCTFRASLGHRPPFTINPIKSEDIKTILGTEEYIFELLSEKEQFKVIYNYSYDANQYSSVFPNMTASGPMIMLQNNETDVIFGGMMMVVSRAHAFTYLCGYHDYNDELQFVVKTAPLVPIWKTVYIEFDPTVWMLLLLAFIVYTLMMIFLLQAKDKGQVALELLDNLLQHSRDIIRTRMMVLKCILIVWVWFAYLINTFYQSSLVSLTTDPNKQYQVSNEDDLIKYDYQPCFSMSLKKFLSTELKNALLKKHSLPTFDRIGCNTTLNAITTVSRTPMLYSLVPNYVYWYNKPKFNDEWGKTMIYRFEKPYAKFLFDDADLYTYNPFDNFNCGKRYDDVISYGKCSEADSVDLYPSKFITGLRNCTFKVWTTQWPPYTMVPAVNSTDPFLHQHGAEPYLLSLIGEMLGFNLEIVGNRNITDEFPIVSKDMEATGSLKRIQDNEIDIIVGGMLLVPSRAAAFYYVYGHQVYTEEIRFVVRRATDEPAWKNIYLEFSTTVWVLLLLTLVLYSIILIKLLRAADKSYIVLILVDILLLHGRNIRSRWMVKMVLLSWIVFTYLVNVFYQSNLVSLTTNPAQQYQISEEEDIFRYKLKPCLSLIMSRYYVESVQSDKDYDVDSGCYGLMESVESVARNNSNLGLLFHG
ncbi:unnamed protein product [Spodoptera littoralis]|uniref:Uncharacterized protein n=1 Tax=Spodoptera littoralis TaxID=7109 RepID=A0A9P0N6H6_SPOLI|nr:unnamed protein product [Spodoptera littoralis]CAH1646823.1 unnamed protein product [Spodoptera littoralis]